MYFIIGFMINIMYIIKKKLTGIFPEYIPVLSVCLIVIFSFLGIHIGNLVIDYLINLSLTNNFFRKALFLITKEYNAIWVNLLIISAAVIINWLIYKLLSKFFKNI